MFSILYFLCCDEPECFLQLSATQPCKSFKFFEFSNYYKISRLSSISLKIGNPASLILLFSFLVTILFY